MFLYMFSILSWELYIKKMHLKKKKKNQQKYSPCGVIWQLKFPNGKDIEKSKLACIW